MRLFKNLSTDLAEEVVKSLFLFIAQVAILFTIEGHPRNIPEKLFQNPSSGSGEEVV